MKNHLFRSQEDVVIGGVCGGLGAFLGINPVILRVIFILLAFGQTIGIWLYLLLWTIIPIDSDIQAHRFSTTSSKQDWLEPGPTFDGNLYVALLRDSQTRLFQIIGFGLILIGVLYLFPNLKSVWLERLYFDQIWPIILIIGGLAFIFRRPRGENSHATKSNRS